MPPTHGLSQTPVAEEAVFGEGGGDDEEEDEVGFEIVEDGAGLGFGVVEGPDAGAEADAAAEGGAEGAVATEDESPDGKAEGEVGEEEEGPVGAHGGSVESTNEMDPLGLMSMPLRSQRHATHAWGCGGPVGGARVFHSQGV